MSDWISTPLPEQGKQTVIPCLPGMRIEICSADATFGIIYRYAPDPESTPLAPSGFFPVAFQYCENCDCGRFQANVDAGLCVRSSVHVRRRNWCDKWRHGCCCAWTPECAHD